TFTGFEDIREEDSVVVENGSLKPRKTTGNYKDFGKSVNEVWSEAFVNYMLVINILFGTPELSAALPLFYLGCSMQAETLLQSRLVEVSSYLHSDTITAHSDFA
ncbi:hypothetical protein MMC31_001128, partial [Peltigera leucophlebia]|nr:hypothetical protein [Peltigera leucophlebia]